MNPGRTAAMSGQSLPAPPAAARRRTFEAVGELESRGHGLMLVDEISDLVRRHSHAGGTSTRLHFTLGCPLGATQELEDALKFVLASACHTT
ncbi:hypothetical protein HTZ77_05990 [Nonomuraea sp. SMC257]|uniref:Uncharacterized protein n=1 Tax=Nonomuraea montanisoli TaxID=2741721 RepID=A0A7Y6I582_9ACTN|nr:hypothetical protein [Nonomuraea montanisoli]NUW30970.1 hypothetical protein [Nonomuraea montanisoli]